VPEPLRVVVRQAVHQRIVISGQEVAHPHYNRIANSHRKSNKARSAANDLISVAIAVCCDYSRWPATGEAAAKGRGLCGNPS
jgi:hypothetical protein